MSLTHSGRKTKNNEVYYLKSFKLLQSLKNLLKPTGNIFISVFEESLFNFKTNNSVFNAQLLNFQKNLSLNYQIGPKTPSILEKLNFVNIVWESHTFHLKELALKFEIELTLKYFKENRELFTTYFYDENDYYFFVEEYIKEMKNTNNYISKTKYLIKASVQDHEKFWDLFSTDS
jgi:hypothetical protein